MIDPDYREEENAETIENISHFIDYKIKDYITTLQAYESDLQKALIDLNEHRLEIKLLYYSSHQGLKDFLEDERDYWKKESEFSNNYTLEFSEIMRRMNDDLLEIIK